MTRGLVRNEPLAQRERAVEYPSDSDYCALFQGAEEPRSQGAKEPRSQDAGSQEHCFFLRCLNSTPSL